MVEPIPSRRLAVLNSVRGRLVLLTVSLLAPAMLFMTLLLVETGLQTRRQMDSQLLTTARALSATVDREVAQGVILGQTLATDQALLDGQWTAFHARARRAVRGRAGWLVLIDPTGRQILNSRLPIGAPLPTRRPLTNLADALSSGQTRVSNLGRGMVVSTPIIAVDTPVTIAGRPYSLAYVVEASSFTSIFAGQKLPPGWVATILDRNRRVIARSSKNARFVGHQASADMAENLRRSSEGVNKSRSLENVPTIVAYHRSSATGWTLVVAIPRAEFAAVTARAVAAATAVFAGLLTLGLVLAFYLSRRINGGIRQLVAAADAIGDGREAVVPIQSLSELHAVGLALTAASDELQTRDRRQTMMINELNHRVKNTLATVQSLARQSFAKLDGPKMDAFTERLIALSAAHDLLIKNAWQDADLGEVLLTSTGAYDARVSRRGPAVALNAHSAVSLSMVVHELATNSAKYGALSASGGRVEIVWRLAEGGERLVLAWIETGGPPVTPPLSRGFGSRLIEAMINRELRGETVFDFRPDGLCFEARLPVGGAIRWSTTF